MIQNEDFDKEESLNQEYTKQECDIYNLDSCFGTIIGNSCFSDILKEMNTLYQKKNHDYGDSFEKSCNTFGLTSPIIRMYDKINRLIVLNESEPKSKDESIEDTLLDLANYAVMTLAWLRNNEK